MLADDTVVEPDVLVARRCDLTERDLPAAPVLAVEVLSPSTRRIDQLLKHERYARAGVAHSWIVDPLEPGLVAYELRAGAYAERGHVAGRERFTTAVPFDVTVVPDELVADR